MSQTELNRAVARATGESVNTIERLGFFLAEPDAECLDPEDEALGPYVIDWDTLEAARHAQAGREGLRVPA